MENQSDIEKALKQFRDNLTKYAKAERYYKGDHDLAFASKKFKNAFGTLFREFALNLCPAVCDALRDKLKIKNFKVESGDKNLPTTAWKIWQDNRMGRRSRQVHKEAIKNGDAYVIVWVDPDKKVTIYPQKSAKCMVVYDEETPGKILWGAKYWLTNDKKFRLNMFYPDRVERYISKAQVPKGIPDGKQLIKFTEDGKSETIRNPYNVVPIFHFANNADVGDMGESELVSAIPIQDGLNKSVLDMLVAMEFVAMPQRYAAGIEIEYDDDGNPIPPFKSGVERVWFTENTEAKFGSFATGDLKQFLEVKADFRIDMACATGTPMYYFMLTNGTIPSGESLKKSETRFINKVDDRQESFGEVWEAIMSFALRIEGEGENVRLFTDWQDPAPLSETEKLNNIVLKKEIGISDEQALIEAEYGETDIERMTEEKRKKAKAEINSFNAGEE